MQHRRSEHSISKTAGRRKVAVNFSSIATPASAAWSPYIAIRHVVKSESRSTKSETNPNLEIQMIKTPAGSRPKFQMTK
jgi:hypothetical protein